ncbi:hypothetical protein E2C01_000574 [Portunus trituberculatus]|uniref:Uncharacterized protein n=1 Tax=Portunus trituberculatus TaxID=210409 RepID=A0A5B7CFG3_PORTR|nr:hypothetical protein [Portunus trituberculatus]
MDKVVSVGLGRCPHVDSYPTIYHFEAIPFDEWIKITYARHHDTQVLVLRQSLYIDVNLEYPIAGKLDVWMKNLREVELCVGRGSFTWHLLPPPLLIDPVHHATSFKLQQSGGNNALSPTSLSKPGTIPKATAQICIYIYIIYKPEISWVLLFLSASQSSSQAHQQPPPEK